MFILSPVLFLRYIKDLPDAVAQFMFQFCLSVNSSIHVAHLQNDSDGLNKSSPVSSLPNVSIYDYRKMLQFFGKYTCKILHLMTWIGCGTITILVVLS